MPRRTFLACCCQCPCGESLPTQASTGDPSARAGSSVSCGITAPFLWVLVHAEFCLCPWRLESLFSPVLWKFYNQIPLALRLDSLGIPSPFVRSPGWKAWCGVQNYQNSVRTPLVLLFSSLWVTHMEDMGFDLIVIVLLLLSPCSSFFVFGRGVFLFDGFQCPPVDGCSTASCNFGVLGGGEECVSFYSVILDWKPYLRFKVRC